MDARTRLAELELMEKLATMEADEAPSVPTPAPGIQKAASDGSSRVDFVKKAARVIEASRRAGRARAEAEIANLLS